MEDGATVTALLIASIPAVAGAIAPLACGDAGRHVRYTPELDGGATYPGWGDGEETGK